MPEENARFFDLTLIKQTVALFTVDDGKNRRPRLWLLLITNFSAFVAVMGNFGIYVYYVSDFPLCWDSVLLGISSGVSLSTAVIGGLVGFQVSINFSLHLW